MYKKHVLVLIFGLVEMSFAYAQMKSGWVFHDELIAGLEFPKDTIYVQNRKKLEKFPGFQKFHDSSVINYKTKRGKQIHILFASTTFDRYKHKFRLDSFYITLNNQKEIRYSISNDTVDNVKTYGVEEGFPAKEIKDLKIKWDDRWLIIPKTAYSNLFNPGLDIEVYLSKNNKLLYLYMSGSDGGGSYSVKFVFDKKGYVTRLITTNECADGFDFLDGRGECEE